MQAPTGPKPRPAKNVTFCFPALFYKPTNADTLISGIISHRKTILHEFECINFVHVYDRLY